MKQNKEIISQDKCKIELENIVQDYKRKIGLVVKKTGIYNDLSDTAEWKAYIKSNPDKMHILDSKE